MKNTYGIFWHILTFQEAQISCESVDIKFQANRLSKNGKTGVATTHHIEWTHSLSHKHAHISFWPLPRIHRKEWRFRLLSFDQGILQ